MKKNKNKKTFIVLAIVAVIVTAVVLAIVFFGKEKVTLSCKGIKEDETAKLTTNVITEKAGDNVHINYAEEIEFLGDNEFAETIMFKYVEKQVLTVKQYKGATASIENTDSKIMYEFNFDINSLNEEEVKGVLGIYSNDIEELKNHFESRGLICEEI